MKKILLALLLACSPAWGANSYNMLDGLPTSGAPTASISAGVLTIDLSTGNYFTVSNTANITTFTVTNPPASGYKSNFILCLTANGSGFTQVYPGTTLWPGGSAPTLTTTNGKKDCLGFLSRDGGTNWIGFVMGQNI